MTTEAITDAPAARPAERSLRETLSAMRAAHRREPPRAIQSRVGDLERLAAMVLRRQGDVVAAIESDFGHRSRHETLIADVFTTVQAARHAAAHVAQWAEPEARAVSWMFQPGRAELRPQPLGVVGIIAPWNYPLTLALSPLVAALAAGDRAMLKPSEYTPALGELLRDLVADCFADDHVAVVLGGPDVAADFARLPFDHLVFTGSTNIGRKVMLAAAENLTPVTLELGGKSPVIVAPDANLDRVATSVAHAKLFNAGQTCIAPDYALVPEGKRDAFVDAVAREMTRMYPTLAANPDYSAVIDQRHLDRLRAHVDDARAKGAAVREVNPAGESLDGTKKMVPAIIPGATREMSCMGEELFGPVLPVIGYRDLDEAIELVNDLPRPLALYPFTDDPATLDRVLTRTTSGGVTVNDCLLHFAQEDLPFGGVGPSGMGAYHGREGFEALSRMKPVFYQSRVNGAALLRPPYGAAVDTALRFLLPKK